MNVRADWMALALTIVGVFAATLYDHPKAAAEVITVTYGPYVVPASDGSGPGNLHLHPNVSLELPCTDAYITRMESDMVYADGTSANFHSKAMLHHVVFYNAQAADLTCGVPERFLASGNERSIVQFPDGYGYYNSSNSEWALNAHLMNFDTVPQTTYLTLTCTCEPGGSAIKPVVPLWLDTDGCGDSEFTVPAGYSDTQNDVVMPVSGTIVEMGGHVHNYGVSVSAEHLDTGEYIFTSIAGFGAGSAFAPAPVADGDLGHPGWATVLDGTTDPPNNPDYMGHIQHMTSSKPFFTVQAGDTIRLHTQHNIPAGLFPTGRTDVMGIIQAYIHLGTEQYAGVDLNKDGLADASTDGNLIQVVLFGLPDANLMPFRGVTPLSNEQIRYKIQAMVGNLALDVNEDGTVDASTDGNLIQVVLFGMQDSYLTPFRGNTFLTDAEIKQNILDLTVVGPPTAQASGGEANLAVEEAPPTVEEAPPTEEALDEEVQPPAEIQKKKRRRRSRS